MKRFTHAELLEMLPAYSLGALTREEAEAVDAALSDGSPESRELSTELRALQEVATRMASVHRIDPPPALKERLLARISAEKSATMPPGGLRRTPAWLVGVAAASLVAAVGLGLYSMNLRDALERRERQLNAILEADQQMHVARVMSADTMAGPGLQFFWNVKQRRGIVHAFRMPPAAPGRSYQVWLLQDGKPFSVSVFNSDADGHALVENLTLPETPRGATLVLVTDEPAGGSPGPTTTPFMRGELQAPR